MGKQDVQEALLKSSKIAILSGAGVSTLSGIKDFRGEDGLYNQKVYGLTPERILSAYFFNIHRELFYKYYLEYMMIPDEVLPNVIHKETKRISDAGRIVGVITQNIDGLYQKAGLDDSKLVEIHGNGNRWVCLKCKQVVNVDKVRYNSKTGNYFSPCHDFIVRPDIVLYDEMFKKEDIQRANTIYEESDVLIVMGTTLDIVYHKDSVLNFKGKIILLNNQTIDLGNREWDAEYIGNIEDVLYN